MRAFAWLPLACVLASGQVQAARSFTVEDLLSLREAGRAAFSPDQRWLVVETFAPWREAPRYDHDALTSQTLGRLVVVDLKTGGAAKPLLETDPQAGDTLGAFSPDGSRVIVFRLRDHRRVLGIVTLATGAVVWTDLTVEPELWTAAARWRNDRQIVAISRPAEAASRGLGGGWQPQARIAAGRAAATAGHLSVSPLGSGRFANLNPPADLASLVLIDADTGQARTLARSAFADLSVSPGGRLAAVIEEGDLTAPTGDTAIRTGDPPRQRRLALIDLADGHRQTPCETCDLLPYVWSWSPDGETLLAFVRAGGPAGPGYWRFSTAGAAPIAPGLLAGETGGKDPRTQADASWLGGDPVVLARPAGKTRTDWWRLTASGPVNLTAALPAPAARRLVSGPEGLVFSAGAQTWRIGDHGAPRPIGGPEARLRPGPVLPSLTPSLALTVRADSILTRLTSALADAGPAASIPNDARLLALGTGGAAAVQITDASGVGRIELRAPGQPPRLLLTLNPDLAGVAFAAPVRIDHPGPDGEALTSWLYLPPGHRVFDDRPIIVVPYPGARYGVPPDEAAPGALSLPTNVQLMAAAGYAVLVPSLPLSPAREPMDGLADAMLRVVDAARAAQPGLSATRLAVWGQSYGGYGALAAGVQSPRFKAVIASAPITNLFSFYGAWPASLSTLPEAGLPIASQLAWSETGQGRMGAPPWRDPQRYLRNSPGLQTERLIAPVMLIYGDLDFDIGQAQTVFASLYRQGKDAQLLIYRGEGHVVLSPDNVRDLYGRAFAFLRAAMGAPSEPSAASDVAAGGAAPATAPAEIRPSQ